MNLPLQMACIGLVLVGLAPVPQLDGEPLEPTQLPEEWIALLDHLRSNTPLRAEFSEERTLSVRKKPILAEGTLRLISNGAISLHYPDATDPTTLTIDTDGIALREGQGKWRSIPQRAKARAFLRTIAALLALDLTALDEDYMIDGRKTPERWCLMMDPRPDRKSSKLGRLVVEGTPDQVSRIELNLESNQKIEITILQVEPRVTWTPDEFARFFR